MNKQEIIAQLNVRIKNIGEPKNEYQEGLIDAYTGILKAILEE